MTEATPRPWEQLSRDIWSPVASSNVATVSEPRPKQTEVGYHELSIGSENFHEAIANAALIVRSVNNAPALAEALEELMSVFKADTVGRVRAFDLARDAMIAWKVEG